MPSWRRRRPGAISYASAGSGTTTFTSAELFKTVAGVDMLHVSYRGGGEAITPVYFAPLSAGLPQVRGGRLRPLVVTSTKRLPMMPELLTVAESGYPGFESRFWYGLMVPAKTPRETIAAIREATVAALRWPEVSKRMRDIVLAPVGEQPEEFTTFVKSEIEKWGKIIRATGLTAN